MINSGSFRDPSGFVYTKGGRVYRQVNPSYQEHYDKLIGSGLYEELAEAGLLVRHRDITGKADFHQEGGYKLLEPDQLDFISYPYEWSFSQLKDAALATLDIQQRALKRGMVLKDATAYNIQFVSGKPLLIDTLSFEVYKEGEPWVAYRQFCQHFLAPLALMAHADVRLLQLMRVHIDGIPLDLAARLLPRRTLVHAGLASHIHLHAGSQRRHAANPEARVGTARMSRLALDGLTASLLSAVRAQRWKPGGTEWGEYYDFTNYSKDSFQEKRSIISGYLDQAKPGSVWDLGANNGLFSRIASSRGIPAVAWDIDPVAVEKGYRQVKEKQEEDILPLVLDLTNPSPGLGWANAERASFADRGRPGMLFALALIHHLTISNNLPFAMVAGFFSSLSPWLVIEFVPKPDSQVQKLLATREDIFGNYDRDGFESEFSRHYDIVEARDIPGSERTLYLMKAKGSK